MEIPSIDVSLDYYESIRERTRRVVACVPNEHMDWRPAPGRFSFADLIRHLAAIERYMFAENVAGRPSSYPGHGPELADGPDAVRTYFEARHAEAMEIFRGLDADALQQKCGTPGGATLSTWKWLRAMVEHEVHHRGQLYLMLGLIGASAPPMFGLTSEQVRENSITGSHAERHDPRDLSPRRRRSMIEHVHRLFRHMFWADDRLVTLLEDVDVDADAGREIARLFAHLIAAERVWLLRATGGDASSALIWPDGSLGDSVGVARETRAGYERLLEGVTEDDLRRVVEYRNSKGGAFHTELGDVLLHVAMHGSYHRGQIAVAVRRGGGEPVNTDYITYVRETG